MIATGFSAALYHSQFLPISIYLSLSSAPTVAEAGDLSITQLYIYSHCSSIAQKSKSASVFSHKNKGLRTI